LLFATAREAAGRGQDEFELTAGASLGRLLADAVDRYGPTFAQVLGRARVWVNGDEPASGARGGMQTALAEGDEVACCRR